jgi:hypothetical protein
VGWKNREPPSILSSAMVPFMAVMPSNSKPPRDRSPCGTPFLYWYGVPERLSGSRQRDRGENAALGLGSLGPVCFLPPPHELGATETIFPSCWGPCPPGLVPVLLAATSPAGMTTSWKNG